ncbi:MAG TPA: hypothetical protein VIM60_11415 [Edaphobacter sp.]
MTPPIGFRTDSPHVSSPLAGVPEGVEAISPVRLADPIPHSAVSDYAYRIVAVTAGLALITTFL